ncbi:unnamed protein product [Lupinus luteus]|uniref:OCEL domain-containing protein n=1 Tax=Lupinus luteus TaxID=3873 RepID=A0AAV1XME1_LUPLU
MKALAAAEVAPRKNYNKKKEAVLPKRGRVETLQVGAPPKSAYKPGLSSTTPTMSTGKQFSSLSSPPNQTAASSSPLGDVNISKGIGDVGLSQKIRKQDTNIGSEKGILTTANNATRNMRENKGKNIVEPVDLQSILISLLMNKPDGMTLKALENAVKGIVLSPKKKIKPIMRTIASYKSPGRYILLPEVGLESFRKPLTESGSYPDDNHPQLSAHEEFHDETPAPQGNSKENNTDDAPEELEQLKSKVAELTKTLEDVQMFEATHTSSPIGFTEGTFKNISKEAVNRADNIGSSNVGLQTGYNQTFLGRSATDLTQTGHRSFDLTIFGKSSANSMETSNKQGESSGRIRKHPQKGFRARGVGKLSEGRPSTDHIPREYNHNEFLVKKLYEQKKSLEGTLESRNPLSAFVSSGFSDNLESENKKIADIIFKESSRSHSSTMHSHPQHQKANNVEIGSQNLLAEMSGGPISNKFGVTLGIDFEGRSVNNNATGNAFTPNSSEEEAGLASREGLEFADKNNRDQDSREYFLDENSSYLKYEKAEAQLKGPITSFSQYKEYEQEYREMYGSYMFLNKACASYRDEFQALSNAAEAAKGDVDKYNNIRGKIMESYQTYGMKHKRQKKILVILHRELEKKRFMVAGSNNGDWYNLEKSKRVKGFRCGEYDEWIEKAKVSAANLSKKALKYARREDAILHALQLESKAVSHPELSDSHHDFNSAPKLPRSGLLSYEESGQNGSSKVHCMQTRRRRTPNDSEDDGTEGAKRMRGLEDLGIGVVSKTKIQDSVSLNISSMGKCLANGTYVSGGKGHSLTLKRKRSQVANVHETLRRKNRRRQLTKVLESTVAMVSVPIICDQLPSSRISPLCGVTDNKAPQLDSNESKRSDSPAVHNSDHPVAACENGTSVNVDDSGREASQKSYLVKDNEAFSVSGLAGNASSDKLVDVSFVRVIAEEKHTAAGKSQVNALEQQSFHGSQSEALLSSRVKDRNTGCTSSVAGHNMIVHSPERAGTKNSDGFSQGASDKVGRNILGAPNASFNCTSQVGCKPLVEGQLDEFRELSKHIKGTTEVKRFPSRSLTPQISLPCRQSHSIVNSNHQTIDYPGRNHCSDASLCDVKLEVKSSYRPQHVPLVSLVSKVNGKAFIGHPLTIEVLDDSHYDKVLGSIGRGLEGSDTHCMVKPNSVIGRIPSKKFPYCSNKKSSKTKKSGLLSKKIRRLSSLTGNRQSKEVRKPVADKLKGPVIACIPLSVVYSRINEATGHAKSNLSKEDDLKTNTNSGNSRMIW